MQVGLAFPLDMLDTYNMKQGHVMAVVCTVAGLLTGLVPGGTAQAQEGYLMAWGMNASGQAAEVPTNLLQGADSFDAGSYHTVAAKGGRAWAWGDNTYGQRTVPVAAYGDVSHVAGGETFSLALKSDGTVLAWGGGNSMTNIPAAATGHVAKIAAGNLHALALTEAGGVVAWGSNASGQTNVPPELSSNVTAIAGGKHFSMALKEGAVHVFGIEAGQPEEHGIRAVPAEASNDVAAISAGDYHALALKTDGTVVTWGFYATNDMPAEATNGVAAIAAGYCFSMVVRTNGDLILWGQTINGQVPIPNYASNGVTQIAAGFGHCLAVCPVLPPRFVSTNLPYGYVSNAYSGSVTAWADPACTYREAGSWGWLNLSAGGEISGMPAAEGSYTVRAVASNEYGSVTSELTVVVFDAPQQLPVFVTTNPLPGGTVGAPYELQIVASNEPSFTWQNAGGGLPPGLTLATNGWLSGTPSGTYNAFFRVLASNEAGVVTNNYNLTITNPPAPVFVTEALPYGIVGQAYSNRLDISHYPTSVVVFSGSLPSGLGLTLTGWITGMPVQVESPEVTVRAANASGATNRTYTLEVFSAPVFETGSPLPPGAVGEPYSVQITAEYADRYSQAGGTLPPGLTLGTNGLVSGTPTTAGLYSFTVQATNDYGWSNRVYDLDVGTLPAFTTPSPLPPGTNDEPYAVWIEATDADSFSITGGTLPPGLTLATNGLLSGTPGVAGPYSFTVQATNVYGFSEQGYDLSIAGLIPPRILSVRATNGSIRLEWTNYNPSGSIDVLRSTNLTGEPAVWTNLGTVTVSPWTNEAPVPVPAYYKLHLQTGSP